MLLLVNQRSNKPKRLWKITYKSNSSTNLQLKIQNHYLEREVKEKFLQKSKQLKFLSTNYLGNIFRRKNNGLLLCRETNFNILCTEKKLGSFCHLVKYLFKKFYEERDWGKQQQAQPQQQQQQHQHWTCEISTLRAKLLVHKESALGIFAAVSHFFSLFSNLKK